MKKVTIEVEFDKYTPFGRTHCEADMAVYEDHLSEEHINKVIDYVRKLFTTKTLFDRQVTFCYRDTDMENPRQKHYVGRIFSLFEGSVHFVMWDENGEVICNKEISNVTKKYIMEIYLDCVARAVRAGAYAV